MPAPGAGKAGASALLCAPSSRRSCVLSAAVGLRPVVPTEPSIPDQAAVFVELDLVGGEHVGRVRNPPDLQHLELDAPAVVRALERGNRLGLRALEVPQPLARTAHGPFGLVPRDAAPRGRRAAAAKL